MPLGAVVPVVVCVGVLRRPVRLVTSGRGLAWHPVVVVCWVTGSGASCCVVRRASGVLWVPPVSVRRRLWGGEGVCVCGAGLWVMSHRRMPSRCVFWRVSRRRLRTYRWSWGAGRLRGWTPRGWSASASMASHTACGIHPPAGRRRQFSTGPGGPGPRGRALPGPTFAAPRAACGSSAATTVPGRGRGLGRRSGRRWV